MAGLPGLQVLQGLQGLQGSQGLQGLQELQELNGSVHDLYSPRGARLSMPCTHPPKPRLHQVADPPPARPLPVKPQVSPGARRSRRPARAPAAAI
ncbi:MAG: hypothetical protein CW345_06325 [Firmicutes bacterium]|nr:hypothetical protein [Bacillota bacterium]